VPVIELGRLGVEHDLDRAEVLARVLVGDLEDRALGEVHQLARGRLVRVDLGLDLVGRVQQPAQHRVLADDAGVLADVADGGHRARQQVHRRAAADRLELAVLLEVLDERERVDGLARPVQREHRREDQPVALAVEVAGLQALVDDQRRQRGVRQQHRAEHGLLGLEVLGRRRRSVEALRAAVGGAVVGGAHPGRPSLGAGPEAIADVTRSARSLRRIVAIRGRFVTRADVEPGPFPGAGAATAARPAPGSGKSATARPPWS
jgi:hypothetical protein